MKREFTLEGLDCANCAAKIERSVAALPGIDSANVNFISMSLAVEHSGGAVMDSMIIDAVRRIEPEVSVSEKIHAAHGHEHAHDHDSASGRSEMVKLIIGAFIFAAGLALKGLGLVGTYAELAIFIVSYVVLGGEIVLRALKNIIRGQVFDENFLMTLASLGAFAIGEYPEAVAVMLFYQVGEHFQERAVAKSKRSIESLMDIRPDFANLKTNGGEQRVSPDIVAIGDTIIVRPGEKIPLDGVVTDGRASLDTRALTGESLPRKARVNDEVLSGCINQDGVLAIRVTKTFGESTVSKILDLVQNASGKKAPTESFITAFSRYYTPAVVGLAALIAVVPPLLFGGIWADWVNRGLIFLVISCPCALVISIPLGFFGGIGSASKKGILVKGGNYLEALNSLDIVVFDKTGTLTRGVFEVNGIYPANGFSGEALLGLAARAEAFSNHPIALSIMKAYGKGVDKDALSGYAETAGHGVSVSDGGKTILAGNRKLMGLNGISFIEPDHAGTRVYVAVGGVFAGCIVICDSLKPDSFDALARLKAKGVRKTVMLTGDNEQVAQSIARELNIDEVYGGLLPAEKVEKLEQIEAHRRAGGKLAFVGDGINDAPVLARADIGVAMGALGSDAAIEAADIVLMTDEPSKLADAMDVAKKTKRIVTQNIVLALGIKGVFLLLGAFGAATMWEAVFADVGVSVLAIVNSMRVLK